MEEIEVRESDGILRIRDRIVAYRRRVGTAQQWTPGTAMSPTQRLSIMAAIRRAGHHASGADLARTIRDTGVSL